MIYLFFISYLAMSTKLNKKIKNKNKNRPPSPTTPPPPPQIGRSTIIFVCGLMIPPANGLVFVDKRRRACRIVHVHVTFTSDRSE